MTTKPEDSPAVPVVAIPAGWEIMRGDNKPFQAISIKAPNGYSSIVYSHARNPENLLYMLADALLTQPASDHLAAIAALQAKLQESALDFLAVDGQALELMDENKRLHDALVRLCRHFPTDTDMAESNWTDVQIEDACNAYDQAIAAVEARKNP